MERRRNPGGLETNSNMEMEKEEVLNVESEEKNNYVYKKKKKVNVIKLLVILTIMAIIGIYGTRGVQLYLRDKAEKARILAILNSYPQLRTLEADQIIEINSMLENYFLGTSRDVVAADGFTNKEMIEFGINILSDKYSSSGIIPTTAMNLLLNRYFNVTGINYKSEGYSSLRIKAKSKVAADTSKYLFGNIKQYRKGSDIYEMEVHKLTAENAKKEAYAEADIISKQIITMKRIDTTDTNNEITSRYVFVKNNT